MRVAVYDEERGGSKLVTVNHADRSSVELEPDDENWLSKRLARLASDTRVYVWMASGPGPMLSFRVGAVKSRLDTALDLIRACCWIAGRAR